MAANKMPPINRFAGQYHFLSNFYWIGTGFTYQGLKFYTSEHAFQFEKVLTPQDRNKVFAANSPSAAKKIARSAPIRPNWDEIRVDIMKNVLRAKFSLWRDQVTKNPLAIRLALTGDAELIEGNTWGDTFWGQCPLGNGENMLGKLLMKVRLEINHGG